MSDIAQFLKAGVRYSTVCKGSPLDGIYNQGQTEGEESEKLVEKNINKNPKQEIER